MRVVRFNERCAHQKQAWASCTVWASGMPEKLAEVYVSVRSKRKSEPKAIEVSVLAYQSGCWPLDSVPVAHLFSPSSLT